MPPLALGWQRRATYQALDGAWPASIRQRRQGHATAFAQLVHEFLGVPFEQIRYVQGDTAQVQFGRGPRRSAQRGWAKMPSSTRPRGLYQTCTIRMAKRTDVLSPRMARVVADLASDWRQLDERIEPVTDEIKTLAKNDDSCRRVMTVPGIGPIISSAMVAAIGSGAAFAKGRDFSAWIGLVPKQLSTGDRTILGRITKRGNGYLRTLFMQASRSFCCGRRTGRSTASGSGSLAPLSASIPTFWLQLSPTSWRGSPGLYWHKSAAMKRAS